MDAIKEVERDARLPASIVTGFQGAAAVFQESLKGQGILILAAIFGALPVAIGAGAGAELRQPLGVSVVGGLVLSQLLTLFISPVIYIYLDKVDRMLKRRLEPQLEEVSGAGPQRPGGPRVAAAE